jgi:sterol desaturase/sphingolipid hydroxylase (fatty acid hydroxylase superfamily)
MLRERKRSGSSSGADPKKRDAAARTTEGAPAPEYTGFWTLLVLCLLSFGFIQRLGMYLLLCVGAVFMVVERIFPDLVLPQRRFWFARAVTINIVQVLISQLGTITWEVDARARRWELFDALSDQPWCTPLVGGFLSYFANTFIFYWWHRWRHESEFLWVWLHQVHHSPARLEALTSFYKAPLEIFADSVLIAVVHYSVLGLPETHMIYASAFSVYGELLYHMNIRTPVWLGYVFQRPESHRIHHLRDSQALSKNYSDLPLWDILFGTFENPPENIKWEHLHLGFPEAEELKVVDMLLGQNVRKPGTPWSKFYTNSYSNFVRGAARPAREEAAGTEAFTPTHHLTYTIVFWAWFIMALGYTVSGLHKLGCASWRDGSALRRVLENPLARDNALRQALLDAHPAVLQVSTWGALALEILFAPACLWRPTRQLVSVLMIAMHVGIACTIDFADLTLGVLMAHAFTLPSLFRDTQFDDALGHFRPWQFRVFCTLLGSYLAVHFFQLLPYAPALFTSSGMLPHSAGLPTAAFPSFLGAGGALDSPAAVRAFLVVLAAAACVLASQRPAPRPIVCVFLWWGWASLFNRNPLIANPGLPFVGWLLLATALWQEEEDPSAVPPEKRGVWSTPQVLRVAAANALGALGCAQMIGFYMDLSVVRGAAILTVASPLPLAFSHFRGHETFSNAFSYKARTVSGVALEGFIDPALYGRVRGAYNFKNAFGAALSYGPFFVEPWQLDARRSVLRYGFCEPGNIVSDSNITGGEALRDVTIHVEPVGGGDGWDLRIDCR